MFDDFLIGAIGIVRSIVVNQPTKRSSKNCFLLRLDPLKETLNSLFFTLARRSDPVDPIGCINC